MPTLTLAVLVPWVIAHGYFLFYIVSVIEGTLVTVAAGVAAGFGYYSIYIIILIAMAADLTGDLIYYSIGYYSRNIILERHGHRFGLNKERMEKIDKMLRQHFVKTMIIVKMSPIIPIPGLISIGASRIPIRKFVGMSLLVTLPKAIFFSLLGFYSLKTYMYLTTSITNGTYTAGGLFIVIFIIYFIYQKIIARMTKDSGLI